MNPRINFVSATVVCITISVTLFGVNAATYEAVGPDNIDPTVCLDEVKTGTIIRTEDSMNNKATFVDAVVSDSYAICAEKCCDYGSAKCDTIVYIEGEKDSPPPTEENCYLFKCWFDGEQNMRCLFADHEGYISSTTGGFDSPQITGDRESGEKIETTTRPYVRKTTTPPQSTTSLPKLKPTSESVEAKVPIKSTTKFPERQDEQVCMVTQYRCPQSRECILKRLVCDDIVDCKDKSDEIGCNRAGEGKIPLSSKPSSHGNNKVKLPESHSGFNTDMYEDEILPSFVDQSDIYNDRDYAEPFQLPPSIDRLSSAQRRPSVHHLSVENQRGRNSDVSSQSESEEHSTDIQHLRSLAEKQKNRNDLLSMSSKAKESDKFPTVNEVSAIRDDVLERCQLGSCVPEETVGDDLAPKPVNWGTRPGHSTDEKDEDKMDMKSDEVKPKIQQQHPDMDELDEHSKLISLNSQRGTHSEQDSSLPVTKPPKSLTRFSKPQHVNPPVKYGPVLSQYMDDDFPEQRYTDNDLFQERPAVHGSVLVRPRTKGNPEPQPRDSLSNPPVISKDSSNTKIDADNVRPQPQEHSSSRSDIRRPDMVGPVVKHPAVQSVTTERPMQWLDHKEPLIRAHHSDVPNRVLKPQVDVVQSDYFPDWPVDISFLYGDSYNIGGNWAQLEEDDNWHNSPAQKGVQRHSDVDDGWYDDRYDDDDDDDQYGFYQPKQRNRGEDRLPSRSRNRYRGNGQQKTHSSGKHRDRNRNYNSGSNKGRQYPSNRKQQEENDNEYPEGGKKPYQEEISIIQPHIATTVPTPEHGESVDEHTNNQKTTLPPNPPPPTHVEGIISLPPGEGKEQELEVDVESVDTVEVAKGALFPLVVGLLLTVFLLMMVGCRLRFMNRRLRYGRMKNNAHDADYLINGMYL
ncbi:Low-density lipoprotein receptor-related protein 11 [Holothuria leucospilota]|uniref:Low-density lipoprotein receptor-related protein 11 n=1 Tax=Holothuria leucospilota TaxID=206669 RepID=A0A9Q1HDT5_HOLLE|nr:Low-density lipoprotein receptor-related protein 11 [Holothuria leucospilota]